MFSLQEKMKRNIRIGRILGIVLFVSGVAIYLLFAVAHPLLHNHPVDGKYHPNCPACNFLLAASSAAVPDAIIIVVFIFFITCLFFRSSQRPYRRLFDKSNFVRGPPAVSF